jgi:hypothetical protein
MHPMSKLERAAYTILAMMDVLSTVFKTREHTAHARVVGILAANARSITVPLGLPSYAPQFSNRSSMPEQIPLPMVQK